MDTKIFTNCLNSSRYWIQEKTSKCYILEQLQHLRILDDDHTKSLYSPSNPTLFPQKQNTIAPKLPGRNHSVPKRKYSEHAPRKFARFEKKASLKKSKRNPRTFFGQINLERKTKNSVNKKGLLLRKTISPFVISHLSWPGTVRACTNFRVQQ